ncbi:MAG: polysaccharide deacetylase family protein [Pseudomonadota bacterium]
MSARSLATRVLGGAYSAGAPRHWFGDRLTVLIYHRVHREHDAFTRDDVDAATFDWQLELLARYFHVMPLAEAVGTLLGRGRLQRGAVAITFDDGYRDNHDVALPLLRKHGLTATFFVATGFLDGGVMWNDIVIESLRRTARDTLELDEIGLGMQPTGSPATRDALARTIIGRVKHEPPERRLVLVNWLAEHAGVTLPDDLMMCSHEVRAMAEAGMEIGAHTVNHPILCKTEADVARREIEDSRAELARITGAPITGFAYPNGRPDDDYTQRDVDIVRELGFDYAMSTRWDVADRNSDRFALPRVNPWDATSLRWMLRVIAARAAA